MHERIEAFKARMEVERAYCEGLFHWATVRLLAHKYAYYILGGYYITDDGYDIEERSWYVMGIALGLLKEDETSPCVGFDWKHPKARRALKLVAKFKIRI